MDTYLYVYHVYSTAVRKTFIKINSNWAKRAGQIDTPQIWRLRPFYENVPRSGRFRSPE